jgi:hypothetical protein
VQELWKSQRDKGRLCQEGFGEDRGCSGIVEASPGEMVNTAGLSRKFEWRASYMVNSLTQCRKSRGSRS